MTAEEILLDASFRVGSLRRKGSSWAVKVQGVANKTGLLVSAGGGGATIAEAIEAAARRLSVAIERHPHLPVQRCKGCGAHIAWAVTRSGKKMPMNVVPGTGTIELEARFDPGSLEPSLLAHVYAEGEAPAGATLYMSHYATCPHATAFRGTGR